MARKAWPDEVNKFYLELGYVQFRLNERIKVIF